MTREARHGDGHKVGGGTTMQSGVSRRPFCGARCARRGTAAAELAICLPLIVMLALASIEACSMIFLEHSLSIASYEGVRVAINYDATNAKVTNKCDEIIEERSVADATILIQPPNVATVPRGTPISLTVTAPCESNSIVPPWFFGGKTLSATVTMVKE